MALSFGRKKGKSAGEPDNPATNDGGVIDEASAPSGRGTGNTSDEPIDESWFESFAEEGATQGAQNATTPDFSVPPATPQPQFSAYETKTDDAPEDFGALQVNSPASSSAPAVFDNGAFVDPASGALSNDATTPFDATSAVDTTTANATESRKGGGLKKLLPILAVLLVLGGGGAFWMSQQGSEEDTDEFPAVTSPVSSQPASPPTNASPATAPPATGAPTGGAPATAPITSAQPPDIPPVAQGDPKIKAQLKKLWNEGLKLRKQNKMAPARAKWSEAVKLARSKPGHAQSAAMIQDAINKLK